MLTDMDSGSIPEARALVAVEKKSLLCAYVCWKGLRGHAESRPSVLIERAGRSHTVDGDARKE